jgi:hypothetical protein
MYQQLNKQFTEAEQFACAQLLTVPQFVQHNPAFTLGGIRAQIFHENTNGLKASGSVIRNGRRVLINCPKYFKWLEARNQGESTGVVKSVQNFPGSWRKER